MRTLVKNKHVCPRCGKKMTWKQYWLWSIRHTPLYLEFGTRRCRICGTLIVNYLAYFLSSLIVLVGLLIFITWIVLFHSDIPNTFPKIFYGYLVAVIFIVHAIIYRELFYRIGKIREDKSRVW